MPDVKRFHPYKIERLNRLVAVHVWLIEIAAAGVRAGSR
jgi:hypothetical protein